jgi:hypothetical protein
VIVGYGAATTMNDNSYETTLMLVGELVEKWWDYMKVISMNISFVEGNERLGVYSRDTMSRLSHDGYYIYKPSF